MTNHEMIFNAIQLYKGRTLKTAEIKEIVITAYPKFCPNSCFPNFHARGNSDECWCVQANQPLFEFIKHGEYKVL